MLDSDGDGKPQPRIVQATWRATSRLIQLLSLRVLIHSEDNGMYLSTLNRSTQILLSSTCSLSDSGSIPSRKFLDFLLRKVLTHQRFTPLSSPFTLPLPAFSISASFHLVIYSLFASQAILHQPASIPGLLDSKQSHYNHHRQDAGLHR